VRYFNGAATSHAPRFFKIPGAETAHASLRSLEAPTPEEWLVPDEQERIDLARDYHRRARIRVPNAKVHAMLHAIVEAQIALGDETPARRTAQRLMDAGLDRHETIHAIAWVLIGFMDDLMNTPELGAEPNAAYFAAFERFSVEDGGERSDDLDRSQCIWR
jgi:hypothetical protein